MSSALQERTYLIRLDLKRDAKVKRILSGGEAALNGFVHIQRSVPG